MASPLLNADVLAIACEFLTDVSDVLSMALTSSSVHLVAIKWLLRMRPVYLKSGPSICQFHRFLFADPAVRAPPLRALHIDLRQPGPPQDQEEDCSLLVDILSTCQRLEHLTVAFQKDSIPTIDNPRFLPAITALPTLRSFSVRSTSIDALPLFSQFRTPLRLAAIHFCDVSGPSRSPAFLAKFIPPVVANALEKLELDILVITPTLDNRIPANKPYPAMRSLSVRILQGKPLLSHLQHLFPALDGTLDLVWNGMLYPGDTHDLLRTENQHSQERHGVASRAWKKLDRVVCDPKLLYTLGLRCPIRHAMLHCHSAVQHRYAGAALHSNPVPRLKVTLRHPLAPLDGLFPPELAGTLTHLTLCLLYSKEYPVREERWRPGERDVAAPLRFEWDDVLRTLLSALQPAAHKLTHLRIVIGVTVHINQNAYSEPLAPPEEYAHAFRPSTFDFAGTATALARALPSLRHVFLTTGGFLAHVGPYSTQGRSRSGEPYERWYVSRGWRVDANGRPGGPGGDVGGEVRDLDLVVEGEPRLVELHNEVADTIIRTEELVLSERDEMALHLKYDWHVPPPPLSVQKF